MDAKKTAVYVIRNTVNGKKYLGISIHPETRWSEHVSDALSPKGGNCTMLYRAIRKYGVDAFTFRVLFQADRATAAMMERRLIALWRTRAKDKTGYNVTAGGEWPDLWDDPEQREAARRRMNTPERKRKSAADFHSPQAIAKRSAALRRRFENPDIRKAMSDMQKLRLLLETDEERARRIKSSTEGLRAWHERDPEMLRLKQIRDERKRKRDAGIAAAGGKAAWLREKALAWQAANPEKAAADLEKSKLYAATPEVKKKLRFEGQLRCLLDQVPLPNKPITIEGVEYPSRKAAGAAYGVSWQTLNSRMRRGIPLREGDTRPPGVRAQKPCVLNGIAYPSQKDAAKAHGVSSAAVGDWIRNRGGRVPSKEKLLSYQLRTL